jgi:hypothetical protein
MIEDDLSNPILALGFKTLVRSIIGECITCIQGNTNYLRKFNICNVSTYGFH